MSKRSFIIIALWVTMVAIALGLVSIAALVYLPTRYTASEWANTKAHWEAQGETFDPDAFIPAPLEDDKNLAVLPLFKMEMTHVYDKVQLAPVTLYKALGIEGIETGNGATANPLLRGGFKGGINSESIARTRKVVAAEYARIFKSDPGQLTELNQVDALYPFINELREASKTRTSCRFFYVPNAQPPVARSHFLIVAQIDVGKVLQFHALVALDEHQKDVALSDLHLLSILASGAKREPGVIPGLIHCLLTSCLLSVVKYGMAIHTWDAAQLSEIDEILRPIELLAVFQCDIRGEIVDDIGNIAYSKAAYGSHENPYGNLSYLPTFLYDHNKVLISDFLFRYVRIVDPHQHRVFMDSANSLNAETAQATAKSIYWFPDILFAMTVPATLQVHKTFFLCQVDLDETRIACALEAGYLTQHAYPENLTGVKLLSGGEFPHDIINGDPYHYQLQKDGTFLLYSVGWNEKDDGGVTAFLPDKPGKFDYQNGDWVWPLTR